MNGKPRIDLNPSSADRWTTCTASPKFIFDNWDKLPKDEDKPFADEGTTAHEVAAAMLEGRPVNPANCPTAVTGEMRQYAFDYWEYTQDLKELGNDCYVEAKFPLWYMPHRHARIDFGLIQNSGLHVVDYKYGEGLTVSPVENLQGAIYARSMVEHRKLKLRNDLPVTIHIFQPRTREGETIKTWETTWGELFEFTKAVHNKAQAILVENIHPDSQATFGLQFAPSEKACQWCPAKGFCHARQAELVKALPLAVIDDAPRPSGNTLSVTQLAAIVKHGEHIKKWIDDAQAFALQHMRAGGTIPGFKLALSRGGNRYWSNPVAAAKALLATTILREDEIYTEPKVQGPAAIEKLLGKGKFPAKVYQFLQFNALCF